MKSKRAGLLLAGALALAFPLVGSAYGPMEGEGHGPSFAHDGGMMHGRGMMDGPGMMHGSGMMQGQGPGMRHGGQGQGMGPMMHLRGLGLSEAQRDKIFSIMHGQAPAMREKHKAIRQAREALKALVHGDTFDAGKARAAADALGKATSEMALLRAQSHAQVHAVLTPEQRKKAEALHQEKGPQGGPGRHAH
jgi:Spy/CpxP family protein refolding chaperone